MTSDRAPGAAPPPRHIWVDPNTGQRKVMPSPFDVKYQRADIAAALERDYEQIRSTFQHMHRGPESACGECGLDLRNPIHMRLARTGEVQDG